MDRRCHKHNKPTYVDRKKTCIAGEKEQCIIDFSAWLIGTDDRVKTRGGEYAKKVATVLVNRGYLGACDLEGVVLEEDKFEGLDTHRSNTVTFDVVVCACVRAPTFVSQFMCICRTQ